MSCWAVLFQATLEPLSQEPVRRQLRLLDHLVRGYRLSARLRARSREQHDAGGERE